MVCASRRVLTRPRSRSFARCWESADWLRPDALGKRVDALLAVDELAKHHQPARIGHGAEQFGSLFGIFFEKFSLHGLYISNS